MKLLKFITALLPRMEKSKILEDLRITISELDQVGIPSFHAAADHFKATKPKSSETKDVANIFYRNFDVKGGKQVNLVSEVSVRLAYIRENADYLLNQIEEIMEHDIIAEGLTAKKAVLIRASESISFVSRFSIDLLNYIYVSEAKEYGSATEDYMKLAPAAQKRIVGNISKFARLLANYGIPNKDLVKVIGNMPDVILNSKTANSIAGLYKEAELDPFASNYVAGFTGSPIYHIRLLVAEWQAKRYENNKQKKRALELRKLHLQMLIEKKNDPKAEQELEYIQGRIDKIDRYLLEVETSLDGLE